MDEAIELGFTETAEKYGLTVSSSGPFSEGPSAGRIGASKEINDFAFQAKPDDISDVTMVANMTNNTYKFVVVKVTEKIPERILPFEEAFAYARSDQRKEVNMQKAYDQAKDILANMGERPNLKQAAEDAGLDFYETEFFTRNETRATRLSSDPTIYWSGFWHDYGKAPVRTDLYCQWRGNNISNRQGL